MDRLFLLLAPDSLLDPELELALELELDVPLDVGVVIVSLESCLLLTTEPSESELLPELPLSAILAACKLILPACKFANHPGGLLAFSLFSLSFDMDLDLSLTAITLAILPRIEFIDVHKTLLVY